MGDLLQHTLPQGQVLLLATATSSRMISLAYSIISRASISEAPSADCATSTTANATRQITVIFIIF